MEKLEKQNAIKDFFVNIEEDKFTKVKYVTSKHSVSLNHKGLSFNIEYRRKDNLDKIYLVVTHFSDYSNALDLRHSKIYLILDDDKTIELSNSTTLKTKEVADVVCISSSQIEVEISDYIAIVNSKKIEYSLRCESGKVEGLVDKNGHVFINGFYSAAFDDDFEVDVLHDFISSFISKPNIWELNKTKGFLGGEKMLEVILPSEIALESVFNGGFLAKWPKDRTNFEGDVLFGVKFAGAITAIFTDVAIYSKLDKVQVVTFASKPNFAITSTFGGAYTIKDEKSGFKIQFTSDVDKNNVENIFLKYIQYMSQNF